MADGMFPFNPVSSAIKKNMASGFLFVEDELSEKLTVLSSLFLPKRT